ncbi:MAG TPA: TIGR03013 family PEP-CTERM/XrtA system glycosyltransferase [Chromatiaceae bacterium]|jgi:sugar transferase (PEP-CTERM system associated)|nr:TIGR03013 family PEP-CTERM/XrtA system glycosyltransferase [Chromatiaceae bacterium]HIB84794.1 TIGR03013 family PEP-CTERM/XrtA system glycosyltransferase [Chromatiaceae bacterium]HIN81814.1 TIGR03013 family PEP-CTERM/XrtA system glycosyltransferase [Chromatiales bacterium]
MIKLFNQYIPKAFFVLMLIETAVFAGSIYVGTQVRFADEGWNQTTDPVSLWLTPGLFALVMLGSMTAMGLYQRRLREGGAGMVVRVAASFLVGVIAMSLLFYFMPDLFLGRGSFSYSLAIAAVLIILIRILFFRLINQDMLKRRVLVLGAGRNAEMISRLRREVDRRGFQVIGFIPGEGDELLVPESMLVRPEIPLAQYAAQANVDEIVVAVDDRRRGLPVHEMLDTKMSGVDVVDVIAFFERESLLLKLDILRPSWLIFSEGFRGGNMRIRIKRAFDVVAALLLILIAWPFMLLSALAILSECGWRGPVLFRQVRVGENWKLFHVLKFRSMRVDAESDGVARWATRDDDRITRVGAVLRKLRFDELPQVFNVLRGDMSFVGPRPERPEFVENLSETLPYYAERHRVKPGITGWAQLCYPYGSSEQDAFEKLQYDLYYVKNYNLFLDLMILLQTAEVVLWRKGAV